MDVRSWWLGFDVARCDLERHLLLWSVPTLAVAMAGADSPGGNSRADVGLWGDRVLGAVSAFRGGDGVDRINDGCDELNAKIPSSSDEGINEYNGFQLIRFNPIGRVYFLVSNELKKRFPTNPI